MRVVSGIQPTGDLHLGNLLGAILRWTAMQEEAEASRFFFLADLHAITVDHDPAQLRRNVREMAAALLAAGIDPERSVLFAQSDVPAHAELQWLLACTARMGWLSRMTQFKAKSGKNREKASVGLFTYPVLQAADVMLYQATHVPVGEDQKQHIELARDIADSFNHRVGEEVFAAPAPYIGSGRAARVMSLRDASNKMSKSDPSDMSRINLTDDDDTILAKIRKARTDPDPLPDNLDGLEERPEARNLVGIMAAVTNRSEEAVLAEFAGQGFGAFKPALGEALVALLGPIRTRLEALRADEARLDAILDQGAQTAREAARPTLDKAYAALGLRR
ncbi:tryptophan--tRNA ligase [Sphingomicrobium astaxanthinifaciens]|uniref:tryptophan--tRNA ligase n=1 Tax=Sphingomicrobium astaxanthinifaciens TaxID=1227949 RepID=UPI001FCB04B8|nr:tryptophan--tRNA ligase [Sphingomicrobium astaxanthinifaciens]MCJ7422114.1 tryptophan--tRNA ligase [Sphingomicrobium astaxanthinifaciens]